MKDSTSRKDDKKREQRYENNDASQRPLNSQLRLITQNGRTISEKQQAMVERIWEDLIENYSFMDDKAERLTEKDIQQRKEFERNVHPHEKNLNGNWSNTHTNKDTGLSLQDVLSDTNSTPINDEHLKFTKAVQLSQSFILIINREGIIEYANPHFQSVSGYTQNELQGKDLGFLISDLASNEEYEQIKRALKTGITWKGELVNTKKNGEWYIFLAKISPIYTPTGEVIDYIVVGHDVTSFRETEIKLEQAVEEKTILLSELHHRVKNNLAIISGIMQLQAFEEEDDHLKSKLFSSVGRVKTLATMHELLYESSSFTMLEFGNNIHKVIDSIAEMFDKERTNVTVEYSLESMILNINQAHPCSLIINEVITNTYRKAQLNPEVSAKMTINLVSFGKKVLIEIKDNLDSIPDGYTTKNQPLSLQLINTLVRQLNGQYNYLSHDSGTLFTLSFSKENTRGSSNVRLS